MSEKKGLSVLTCVYNSVPMLPETLRHLEKLQIPRSYSVEFVFVDNGSTDHSKEFIDGNFHPHGSIVHLYEPKLGTSWARRTGLKACRYSLIAFVDHDNWVAEDWAIRGIKFMEEHPDAGGVGSLNQGVFESEEPKWFSRFQGNYAIGPQNVDNSLNGNKFGLIWGAGCFLRGSAVADALSFKTDPLVSSRQGKGLLSGDDSEIFYLMQLFGWRFYYAPEIQISHFMPSSRVTWKYLLALKEGLGRTAVYMDMYRRLIEYHCQQKELDSYDAKKELRISFNRFVNDLPGYISTFFPKIKGNFRTTQARFNLGNYRERKKQGDSLEKIFLYFARKVALRLHDHK